MLAVAIVGAGIHAVVVAVRLLHEWPALRGSLRLFDPAGTCLADWYRRTWGQGMETMRSPGAHHLDVPAESLLRFARAQGRERELRMPYHRPSLQLFVDHSRSVIDRYRLDGLVVAAAVREVTTTDAGYRVATDGGHAFDSRILIVAPGLRGHEHMPGWAVALARRDPRRAVHVEALDIRTEHLVGERVLVVGGGLSAATLAEAAAERGAAVTLVSRHRLEARLFDADPGWVGPKYLAFFQSEPDPAARLRMIERARGRGSVTPELLERLRRRRDAGGIAIVEEAEVLGAEYDERRGAIHVTFDTPPGSARVDRVWCCTGWTPRIERLEWLGCLATAPSCGGRPLTGPTLELAPGGFVTGWLAELALGPAARNISGARYAARLIVDTLRARGAVPGEVLEAVA
jgi:cation diffusion facilitator CzcD-associated flavoprotein CzcO